MNVYVDLDGTLIRTDLLWEGVRRLAVEQPLAVFLLPVWLMKGRSGLKREVARRVAIDPARLPYRREVLDHLRREREAGRTLILCTAADRVLADRVAAHLGLFDEVLGTTVGDNLKGARKLAAIERHAGDRGFEYIGDALADLPIFAKAAKAIVVAPGLLLRRRLARFGKTVTVLEGRS